MGVRSIDIIIVLLATLVLTGYGFLLAKGPQCHQCTAAFSPHSCIETVSCLSDQECYTERYLTSESQQVYRLGCLAKGICGIAVQSANDTHCFKCCGDSRCNSDICMKDVCQLGYYGPFCAERCGHCSDGQQCDMATGRCPNGCVIGYLPPFCKINSSETCPEGFYGPFCSDVCGHCSSSENCEINTGRCINGCQDGFLPPYCHAACPVPFYGPECSKTCGHCAGDKLCEFVSGICRDGCQPGFSPPYCVEEAHPETSNPRDCREVRLKNTTNGIYELTNNGGKVTAWCDMVTDNGGWIVFQRRVSDSVTFDRPWIEYRHGFGKMSGNFWWGNDKLSAFTSNGSNVLRIDMEDPLGHRTYAQYQNFYVENEQAKFRLHIGEFTGNAGNSMNITQRLNENINGQMFSTRDQDNDRNTGGSCAKSFAGGWWFNACSMARLNGRYLTPGIASGFGIVWYSDTHPTTASLKWVEMKFRSL